MRRALVAPLACAAACNGSHGGPIRDGCADACAIDEVCRYSACVPTPSHCGSTDDCHGDSYCDTSSSECLPWGVGPGGASDPSCRRELAAGAFVPEVECAWHGPPAGDPFPEHVQVLSTPLVARFGGASPSIVFLASNAADAGQQACTGSGTASAVIRVIDGATCAQQATIAMPVPIATSSLALADLDRDGVPEVLAAIVGGGLAAWKRQPDGSFAMLWTSNASPAVGQCVWTGPSVHDLDDDGIPEVLFYGAVFDAAGQLRSNAGLLSTGLSGGYVPVAADLDGDGVIELVAGSQIFHWTTAGWSQGPSLPGDAHVAIADLGTYGSAAGADDRDALDGIAEVVWARGGNVAAYTAAGRAILGPIALPGGGDGGPPALGDFDGDGRVELAVAGGAVLAMIDPDASAVTWTSPIAVPSSSETAASAFDFDGDGSVEVVMADECFARIYAGSSGEVLMSRERAGCTLYDYAPVVDTNGDFAADLVIADNSGCATPCPAVDPLFDGVRCASDADCPSAAPCVTGRCRCQSDADCGGSGLVCRDPIAGASADGMVCRAGHASAPAPGVTVIGDRFGRFVGARPIWNQHAWAATQIADDGLIPRTSAWSAPWLAPGGNGFRMGVAGEPGLLADVTVHAGEARCGSGTAELVANVCDRGTRGVAAGVAVAFTMAGAPLCTATTTAPLAPGFCADASCSVAAPIAGSITATAAYAVECRATNNTLDFEAACP
jgi:hypothetical protein